MPSCCTFAILHGCGEGFGLFHLQTRGSLHSSNKNANSISKLNPASCAFYLGHLFLWPTTFPSTMPLLSYHLCKLPSTASKSAFFPTAGILHSRRKCSRWVQWVIFFFFLLADLNWSQKAPFSFFFVSIPTIMILSKMASENPNSGPLQLWMGGGRALKFEAVWSNSSSFQKTNG